MAWGVHLYTATGLVLAAAMAVAIYHGGDEGFRRALLLMIVATLIDSTDGALARRARVREVLPGFDGRRLDDITDFLTYTALPLLLLWRAGTLPAEWGGWLLVPLLASAYGFSQTEAKTEDHYFLGFPSYWNALAIYLYLLRPAPAVALALLILFSVLTFVPARYLYPSFKGPYSRITIILALPWAALLAIILTGAVGPARWLVLISLAFPIYYLVVSWLVTLGHYRARIGQARAGGRRLHAPTKGAEIGDEHAGERSGA
jgi:phosphatidylcholine synthase